MAIYLDYAATAPLRPSVAHVLESFTMKDAFGNANSLHSRGRAIFSQLEKAREDMADAINARRPDEIIFTSGATEANAVALYGIAEGVVQKKHLIEAGKRPHILFSAIEHHAVLENEKILKRLGYDISYIPVNTQGLISIDDLHAHIRPETILISVMLVNNETGVILPVREIADIAHKYGIYIHCDAVQAFGKLQTPLDVNNLGVDALSLSAHKVGGPTGVGVLYIRQNTPFVALVPGGGQERGKRGGTQNVAGIVGATTAFLEAREQQAAEYARISDIWNHARKRLHSMQGISLTLDDNIPSTPYIIHMCVKGWDSQALLLRLDVAGVQASSGSACSSQTLEPSHVLTAMHYDKTKAQGALRFSFGTQTTMSDVDEAIDILQACMKE